MDTSIEHQNWLITPAALAVGETPPASIYDQKWLLVLSGVASIKLQGNSNAQWLEETLCLSPDMAGENGLGDSGPLNWAIRHFSIPMPPPPPPDSGCGYPYQIYFSLEEWAPFASLGWVFDQGESINAGFAVEKWRPHPFVQNWTNALTDLPAQNIFTGIDVDVAVRDNDAWIYGINYNITLLGKIVFIKSCIF